MSGIGKDKVFEDNMKSDKRVPAWSSLETIIPYRSPNIGWMDKISHSGLNPWTSLEEKGR